MIFFQSYAFRIIYDAQNVSEKNKHNCASILKVLLKMEQSYATFQTQSFYINGNTFGSY